MPMSYRMVYRRAPEMRLLSYLCATGSETYKEIKLLALGAIAPTPQDAVRDFYKRI